MSKQRTRKFVAKILRKRRSSSVKNISDGETASNHRCEVQTEYHLSATSTLQRRITQCIIEKGGNFDDQCEPCCDLKSVTLSTNEGRITATISICYLTIHLLIHVLTAYEFR